MGPILANCELLIVLLGLMDAFKSSILYYKGGCSAYIWCYYPHYSASGLACTVTELIRIGCSGTSRSLLGTFSTLSSVSKPDITLRGWGGGEYVQIYGYRYVCEWARTYLPNTVYFLLRCAALLYAMKNWLPFVLGPLFAIETTPRVSCWGR